VVIEPTESSKDAGYGKAIKKGEGMAIENLV
jgi:hypothetical protein